MGPAAGLPDPATVATLQQPDSRPARYIVSAQVERKPWQRLYAEERVTAENPEPALKALGARFNLTGLGAFIPIEPFA